MLREMSWKTFIDWMTFSRLEPLDRDIYQLALIAQVLTNLHRDPKKNPNGWPLMDFVLNFDREEKKPEPKQSVQDMERIITGWIHASNLEFQSQQKSVRVARSEL